MEKQVANKVVEHSVLMDQVYRFQRHIYDFTRKYFLFGRDTLIKIVECPKGGSVLEVGVGTARNLLMLSKRLPEARYYGVDASREMLSTAVKKINASQTKAYISLEYALAESFNYKETFRLEKPFDVIFLSYALSMFSTWKPAIDNAFANLAPGGRLYVVDFWDQADYPQWFANGLKAWLRQFHVAHKPEALEYLMQCAKNDGGEFSMKTIGSRYAYVFSYQRRI